MNEIYATIATLPEDFRLAVVAVDVLGLSYREAARALRVREATLTTRVFRGRKQVAKRLGVGEPELGVGGASTAVSATESPAKSGSRQAQIGALPGKGPGRSGVISDGEPR